ncbi:2-nitropropane dioxygenase [Mycena venus]|uniref:2-nitropropane dioxygenase n=1 Tax=Mycena venus TaxID=2733690 RepID=A0A8H7D8Y1_9AGAR|nr:2-nitropropane dioxygenase [Mycena venus]
MAIISTPVTELFGISHPVILAGMSGAAGPELAAAVSNAGTPVLVIDRGLGVIGGVNYTPRILRQQIRALKDGLADKSLPFGVDLLIPQVGGNARKTNYDYTKGKLGELLEVIIEEKASLFCFTKPAFRRGEGGGHTGDIPASILIPACVDAVKGHKSPLTGKPVYVVGAGAVYDGRGLAANLMWGAEAVWVGTRFVASVEAGAAQIHKDTIVKAGYEDAVTTLIFSGRPLRVYRTPYVDDWNNNRQAEIKELTRKGLLPHDVEMDKHPEKSVAARTWLMGRVSALIHEVLHAKVIVDNMVRDAAAQLQRGNKYLTSKAKL